MFKKVFLNFSLFFFINNSYSRINVPRTMWRFFSSGSTIENIRGRNYTAAYPNQDRFLFLSKSDEGWSNQALFGVFDGHGKYGDIIAQNIVDNFTEDYSSYILNLKMSLLFYQRELFYNEKALKSGTTAVVALLNGNNLTVANIGDSRLVIVRNGEIFFSTKDQKPHNPDEYQRIIEAGGIVQGPYVRNKNGRGLALSRSLGDVELHEDGIIISDPVVNSLEIEFGDVMVIATDGLWDVLSNNYVADLVSNLTNDSYACSSALAHEARRHGSKDDITVVCTIFE